MSGLSRFWLILLLSLCWLNEHAVAQEMDQTVRLHRLAVTDPQINNDEAFTILVPEGWKSEGGVLWRHDSFALATVSMRITAPDGITRLDALPKLPFTWSEGGVAFFEIGSNYLGCEVRPPIADPAQFTEQVVLPRFRRDVDARIVDQQELPEVAKAVAANIAEPGVEKLVKAGRVRIEYEEAGTPIEEDVYLVLAFARSPIMPGTTLWETDRMFCFRAVKGKLDQQTPLMHAMVSSVKIDPKWLGNYLQVFQMWMQNRQQSIRDAGMLSRYIANTSDEIAAMNRQAFQNQQAAQDRINRNFDQYIRGNQEYQHPFEQRPIDLPAGYNDAWANAKGEYILSNDANFDPNPGTNQEWRRMEK